MKVGSLFAGIGGIDLGFKQAGFEVAFANEKDKYACKTYRNNFHDVCLIEDDIKNINAESLPDMDILTAGFPCQPFSVCGNKKGFNDERGNLFFDIMRIADAKKPQIIFLENVANLAEHNSGKTFNVIHNELVSRNYIIRYVIADACNYGVPQHRTRIYIVAFQNADELLRFSFPKELNVQSSIWGKINRSVKSDDSLYLLPSNKDYAKMQAHIKDDRQIYRFSDFGIQSGKDEISFTLKANMGTYPNRIPIIKDDFGVRRISPKECLLLQGFLDSYAFPDIPLNQAYKQAGNTVCEPLIYEIAIRIKSSTMRF